MRAELVHTSLPRGLDGGTGFSVAARTGGMPRALADVLSSLSGLPEAWSEASEWERTLRATRSVEWQGSARWIASVVRPNGLDHTGRGNRIAHHRLLDTEECARMCPVSLLLDHERWIATWRGAPRELDPPEELPSREGASGPADAWRAAFGDAGVAAAALEAAFRSGIGAWIVVPAGVDRLPLLWELAGLLPLDNRWKRGWSTRPLRLLADAAPVICLVDEREPALANSVGAPWAVRADRLQPIAGEALLRAARQGRAATSPKRVGATAAVAWTPPRRIAAPVATAPDMNGESETPDATGSARADDHEPATKIVVAFEQPLRSGRAAFAIGLLVAGALVALGAWWWLRGGAA